MIERNKTIAEVCSQLVELHFNPQDPNGVRTVRMVIPGATPVDALRILSKFVLENPKDFRDISEIVFLDDIINLAVIPQ